jgi:hypothetical protein
VSIAKHVTLTFWLTQLQRHINPPLNRTSFTLYISIYINFTLIFYAYYMSNTALFMQLQVEGHSYKLILQGSKSISRLLSRRLWMMNVCLDYGSMFSVDANLAVQVRQKIGLRMARLCVTWSCQHLINSATVSCSAESTIVLLI